MVKQLIAKAIKAADNRFFSKDYEAQAENVLRSLQKSGYTIVPIEPTEPMIEAGKKAIAFGATRPADLVKNIYKALVVR